MEGLCYRAVSVAYVTEPLLFFLIHAAGVCGDKRRVHPLT